MKLVLFVAYQIPHRKNLNGIQLMCKRCNIEFEYTNCIDRIKENNYDILYCTNNFIDPNIIPYSIKIIYGPQFWVFPDKPIVGEFNEAISKRCVYNCLSDWVKHVYQEMSKEFIMPLYTFPFAVDTEKFQPSSNKMEKEYDCIVYIKRRSIQLVNNTLSLLNQKGMKYIIFKYGIYNEEDYQDALLKCKFMLTLDAHESQGFALEEAMSSDVPLLVMDATSMYDEMDNGVNATYEYLKPKKLLATSVPYWSNECGIKITDESELSDAMDKMMLTYHTFTPRNYIVKTLSDEVCMRRILDYFNL